MNTLMKMRILAYDNHDGTHDVHVAEEAAETLHWEKFARQLMQADDFVAYVKKNGYHFTCKLADYVTRRHLKNADGTEHNWTSAQVKGAMEAAGMTNNPLGMTWGDAAYLANWYYSDEYPDVLTNETAVIRRAYKAAQDPDGYEGMTFARWLMDVIANEWDIDWTAFM